MIKRVHRFHGYGGLRLVYRRGQVIRGPLFSLRVYKNQRQSSYRLAVVVSKKVHKSAVVRNRIRRRIYELFRQEETRITQPLDIVCTVFTENVATMDSNKLRRALLSQLKQAQIIDVKANKNDHQSCYHVTTREST